MKNKIFLTSALIMGFACPAFADTFPNDGNMLENKTYTNAATYTNTGVYEGSVNASATYSDNQYTVTAGHYLPAASEDPTTTCTAGNYCPGLQSQVYYNANAAQGLNACPSGYTNSATGATANTDCYRSCVNSDITHATAITGNVYYNGTNGDGTKACTPTTCENGYHVNAGTPDLTTIIGNTVGTAYTSNEYDGGKYRFDDINNGDLNTMISGDPMAFVVDYGDKGIIKGHGRCSTQSGTNNNSAWSNPTTFATLADETYPDSGEYCYCLVESYTPVNGSAQSLSALWVFQRDRYDEADCGVDCAGDCASNLKYAYSSALKFRSAVFSTIESSPASCDANVINITWADVDPATAGQNNEGTATYGGNINTPFKAATKPGKTFVGWKFVKQQ